MLRLHSEHFKLTTKQRPVSSVVKISLSVLEVWGSIPGPVKSDTVLPTARHRCDVSSELSCQVLSRGDGPATCYALRRNIASTMKV